MLETFVSAMADIVTVIPTTILERITEAGPRLTAAERRVADVLAGDVDAIAFATVAEVARKAKASGPTVVRLAVKLGYSGFPELQAEAQADMARRLRPASERIRQRTIRGQRGQRARAEVQLLTQVLAAEQENVQSTFDQLDPVMFKRAVDLLADRRRWVLILAGEGARPAGLVLAAGLEVLRDDIHVATGSDVDLAKRLARFGIGNVVVAMDLRRYERWVVRGAQQAYDNGVEVVAVSDSLVSPLAKVATAAFVVAASSPGPFDSMVGMTALSNALVAAVAHRLRPSATRRIDLVERSWSEAGVLADD
jgi:DNA-binding MurR/RpiR family transcriptional regulator